MSEDHFHFIFFFAINKIQWWSQAVWAMLQSLLIGHEKRDMEDWMDLPLGRDSETECCAGDDFLNFKGASSFHLELFGPVHMEVGHLQPDLLSSLPW